MENSNLIELIRTLTASERKQILEFANISFFNQGRMHAQVIPLLNICLNHPWHLSEQVLNKKFVFSMIFPNQKFVEGKLDKVMVDAHKVVRSFLLTQYYFRTGTEFQQLLDFTEIVRQKGLDIRYQQQLTRLTKMQDGVTVKNMQFFYNKFLLEYAIHEHQSINNHAKGDINIFNVLIALESYSESHRIALLNRLLLQQKIANIKIPDPINLLIKKELIFVDQINFFPNIKINYTIFNILKKDKPEQKDIELLFKIIELYEHDLDIETLREFYTYLRNICVLVLATNPEYEEIDLTLHELYKKNLDRGFLHNEGKIHPSRYFAVSNNALRIKKFEWGLNFIEKHKKELIGENDTQDIYRLNLANYLFETGQYAECLDTIPATSPFVDYLLHGKRIEIKSLYELNSDLFSYKLDAFKMFLSRTSHKLISETHRNPNIDFANLLTQISTSIPGDKPRAERIINRIHEKKQSAEWRWLLTKAHELKHKRPR